MRSASSADVVVESLQTKAIEDHDAMSRQEDGTFVGLPPEVAKMLDGNWRLYAHSLQSTLKHMKGSFPTGTKCAGVIA